MVWELEMQILRCEALPGARLESQRRMVARYGVARSTVREAVAELENRGLLEVRHGGGSRVRNLLAAHFPAAEVTPEEATLGLQVQVLEAREALEGEAAYYAALRATGPEREALAAEYRRMQARAVGETTLHKAKADLTFHQLIADSCHNLLIASISQLLYSKYFHVIYAVLSGTLRKTGSYPPGIARQHAQIYQALMARDGDAARLAAAEHVAYTRRHLLESARIR
nr:FCD domain-containing protein [Motiliproteus sediminis]